MSSSLRGPNFEFRGIHHVALVSRDMARTVAFYRDVLGMPLVKTLELPEGKGQHFFFDAGGASIAFFWYPDAPAAEAGVVQAPRGGGVSAHGSMNHLAIAVDLDALESYRQRLADAGLEVTEVVSHQDPDVIVNGETTFVNSIYFHDPDGIRLEFAAWTRGLVPDDVHHEPQAAS